MDLSSMSSQLDPRVQAMQQQAAGTLLKVLNEKEKELDAKMHDLENMEEDDFEVLREKRRRAMIKAQQARQKNVLNGHGRYMELSDQKEFFDAAKKSKQLVVHFYRGTTLRCQIVDRHFEALAQTHLETRFVKIDAEKSPFLVERLGIIMLPTLLCCKNGKTEHSIIGFDEMGGSDDFSTEALAYVLSEHGVLTYDGPAPEHLSEDPMHAQRRGVNSIDMRRNASIREGNNEGAADSEEEYYDE